MNEMKFLLVGAPRKDSVWLHLDAHGHAGVSVWRSGKLHRLDHPADWLASRLWLSQVVPFPLVKRGRLGFLKQRALEHAMLAVKKRNFLLFAQSMCTLFGFQYLNGAPPLVPPFPFTIGRMFTVEYNSGGLYFIGLTSQPIVNMVLQ